MSKIGTNPSVATSSLTTAELVARFTGWLEEATRQGVPEPTAMSLATADREGNPSVRIVLLKHADEHGFVFYTNKDSAKGADLRENPRASLCFHWQPLGRQVRVNGRTEDVADAEADAYFATRPRLSQIGAWVSKQSQPMEAAFDLEQACAAYALRHPFAAVPRPPFWSGYRVVPERIEFWSQKPFRRHERMLYTLESGQWIRKRLYP